ncbi:MAG: hypothetical protein J7482_19065 [Roseiflexus sp.]|nr:hypothetical protein [Roseiflexus sp.]
MITLSLRIVTMPKGLSEQALEKIVGRTPNWLKPFDVNDYLNNRPMIEKLYEERQMALAKVIDLESRITALSSQVRQLELSEQRLRITLAEKTSRSLWAFGISLIATVTVGIGVNLVTSSSSSWIGWFLIIIAVLLESIAFVLTKFRNGDSND